MLNNLKIRLISSFKFHELIIYITFNFGNIYISQVITKFSPFIEIMLISLISKEFRLTFHSMYPIIIAKTTKNY